MALLPPLADLGKENQPVAAANDEDDFVPLKKKPKFNPEAMFPQSIVPSISVLAPSDFELCGTLLCTCCI